MTAENGIRLLILLAPYAPILAHMGKEAKRMLPFCSVSVPMKQVGAALAEFPGEVMTAFSYLTGEPVDWLKEHVTAEELFEALPVLDRVNDLSALWKAGALLGLIHV